MSIQGIEKYKFSRCKVNGVWQEDTLFCVLYCMEHRSPDYFDLELIQEYEKLVEIGCEFIVECKEFEKGKELWERIESDYKDFKKWNSRSPRSNVDQVKEVFERASRRAHAAVIEERLIE